MTRLLGYDALAVALAVALFGVLAAAFAARRGDAALGALVRGSVFTLFSLTSLAALSMIYGLVSHDFSISYVAQVGSRSTPLFFTVISLWGALVGSILFWAFLLFGFAALAAYMHRGDRSRTLPFAAATLLMIGVFFLILLIGPANPFGSVSPVPADGPGRTRCCKTIPSWRCTRHFSIWGTSGSRCRLRSRSVRWSREKCARTSGSSTRGSGRSVRGSV